MVVVAAVVAAVAVAVAVLLSMFLMALLELLLSITAVDAAGMVVVLGDDNEDTTASDPLVLMTTALETRAGAGSDALTIAGAGSVVGTGARSCAGVVETRTGVGSVALTVAGAGSVEGTGAGAGAGGAVSTRNGSGSFQSFGGTCP